MRLGISLLIALLALQIWGEMGESLRATIGSSTNAKLVSAATPRLTASQQAGAIAAGARLADSVAPQIVDDLVHLARAMELYDEKALGISKLYSETSHQVGGLEEPTRWLTKHTDLTEEDALALQRTFLSPNRGRDWREVASFLRQRLGVGLDGELRSTDTPFAQKVIAANVIRSAGVDKASSTASTTFDVNALRRALGYAYYDVPEVFRELYASWLVGERAPHHGSPAEAWAGVVREVRDQSKGGPTLNFMQNYDFFLPPPAPKRALEGRRLELAKELWSALGERTEYQLPHLRRDFQGNVDLTEQAFDTRLGVVSKILADPALPAPLRELFTDHQQSVQAAHADATRLAGEPLWSKEDVQAHNAALAKLTHDSVRPVDYRQMPVVTTGSSEYFSFRDLVGSEGALLYETPISTKETGTSFRDHDLDHHQMWGTRVAHWWHAAREFAKELSDPTVEDYVLAVRWEGGAAPEHPVDALLQPPRRRYFDAPELSTTQVEKLAHFRDAYLDKYYGPRLHPTAAVAR